MSEAFDIIVVGGGSAGCAMAARLSQDAGLTVLLLEAGGSERHPFTSIPAANLPAVHHADFDWRYRAEADPSISGREDARATGKRLGGGSAINAMIFARGHPWDFDHWAELGATGWDYASVLPYFKRLETNERGADDFRGGDGPVHVSEGRAPYPATAAWIEACQQAGVPRSPDLNGAQPEGVDLVQVSQRRGWRSSSAAAYVRPALGRPNLALRLRAQARRILFEGTRATGVVYDQAGHEREARAHLGVVMCAGAFNTPRLLMLSGVGPAKALKALGLAVVKDLPGVGANLQDHVGCHVVDEVSQRTLNTDVAGWRAIRHALDFALAGKGALTSSIAHAQALVRTREGLPAPNIQLLFAPFAFDLDDKGRLVLRKQPSISQAVTVMRPRSRGAVALRSPDPHDPPVIRHQLLGEEADLEELAEGMAFARRIVDQPALAAIVTQEVRPGPPFQTDEELKAFLRLASFPAFHPVGTCRMGADRLAVTDPDLRVRGLDGLWIADASVMPTLPAANTNAAAIMIGEKGSDLVKAAVRN